MESGKGAEAGPSKGGVFGDDKEETKRTEKLHDHEVGVAVEESDDDDDKVAAGFVPGPMLSLKDQIERDKEDDSLRRWKETLLGHLEGDLNEQMEPVVNFHSISIISNDSGEIITPLPVNDNRSGGILFTLREGSRYQRKLTFSVLHNIVSGLTYSNSVWKGGLQVDQSKGMLGTFAPQREPYVHLLEEEMTPSGALARGIYSAKLKCRNQRIHMQSNIQVPLYRSKTQLSKTKARPAKFC